MPTGMYRLSSQPVFAAVSPIRSAAGGASASAGALLELSVQAFGQFLLCGVADCEDLAGEIEGLAGHGVIEVHHDAVVLDFMYLAVHYAALLVHHRYHVADCQETFLDLALYLKDVLGQLDYHVGVVLAVAFGGSEGELKGVTGLLAGYMPKMKSRGRSSVVWSATWPSTVRV